MSIRGIKSCPHPKTGGHSKLQLTGLVKKYIYILESTKDVGGLFPQSSSICDYVIMEEWENVVFVFFFILSRGNAVKTCSFH